jgi:O-antigen ligase
MPFTKEYLPYIMFLWVLSGVLAIHKVNRQSFENKILLLFPLFFFLIHVIGLIYSTNFRNGLFDLEVKLSILFIPIVSIFITGKVRLNYRLLFKLFVFGNLIASIICLVLAFLNSVQISEAGAYIFETSAWPTVTQNLGFIQLINQRLSNFSYVYLSILIHPTYFSVYLMFSLAILVYLIRSSKKRHVLYYALIIYFSIFIWLLGSRAGYITYLISFFSFILIIILKFKKYWLGIGAFVIGVSLALLVLTNSQIIKNIKETANIVENNQSLTKDSDIRLWLWKSGMEVFQEHPFFGVGTGDIDEFLNKKYQGYGLTDADLHNYNTHNQYIDVAIKLGVVGLIVFLSWMITTLIITIKKKQFLFFYFTLILFINFFFETMLNSLAGIGFFAFFYTLLYSMYNSNKVKES